MSTPRSLCKESIQQPTELHRPVVDHRVTGAGVGQSLRSAVIIEAWTASAKTVPKLEETRNVFLPEAVWAGDLLHSN